MLSIKTICVCGAGTMGSGIAQVAAQDGFTVIQFDLNAEMLQKSEQLIKKNLQGWVDKEKITATTMQQTIENVSYTANVNDCKADVIIEAIVENKNVKVELFKQLVAINSPQTILTTNTSSISVNAIAAEIQQPQRFAGLHFFNPAPVMKLVEIIKATTTDDATVQTLIKFCKQLNKVPVVCNDAPGFIVNRVARHYYLEAMRLIELNLATIETVDSIMEATGFKMGPFKLMDLIGLDINYSVSNIVWNDLGKPERLKPSVIQQQKVEVNELGRKTRKGFYNY